MEGVQCWGSCQPVGTQKEIGRHGRAYGDYEDAHRLLWEAKRVVRAEESPQGGAANHDESLSPKDCASRDEHRYRDSVGGGAEHDLQRVHLVNVGHAEGGEHGEDYDPQSSSEVAAVDGDEELQGGRGE